MSAESAIEVESAATAPSSNGCRLSSLKQAVGKKSSGVWFWPKAVLRDPAETREASCPSEQIHPVLRTTCNDFGSTANEAGR